MMRGAPCLSVGLICEDTRKSINKARDHTNTQRRESHEKDISVVTRLSHDTKGETMTQPKFETVSEYREYNRDLVTQIRESVRLHEDARHRFLSRKYRNAHIAYCMLRGTAYERIEAKVRENNEPDWPIIRELISNNNGLKHVPREKRQPLDSAAEA